MSRPGPQPYLRVEEIAEGLGYDRAEIWLEPSADDPGLGICLGTGETLPEAIREALTAIRVTLDQLPGVVDRAFSQSVDPLRLMLEDLAKATKAIES
jgi:hypothetical protein